MKGSVSLIILVRALGFASAGAALVPTGAAIHGIEDHHGSSADASIESANSTISDSSTTTGLDATGATSEGETSVASLQTREITKRSFTPLFVLSSMIGIFQYYKEKFVKEKPAEPGSTVSLALGVQPLRNKKTEVDDKLRNLGGYFPDVYIFDAAGREVGHHHDDEGQAKAGNIADRHVAHDGQSVYMLLGLPKGQRGTDGEGAICIAYASIEMDDERSGLKYMFTGDMGWLAGGPWYWGGHTTSTETSYRTRCFWLGTYDSGLPVGVQVKTISFSESEISNLLNPECLIDGVKFGLRWEHNPKRVQLTPTLSPPACRFKGSEKAPGVDGKAHEGAVETKPSGNMTTLDENVGSPISADQTNSGDPNYVINFNGAGDHHHHYGARNGTRVDGSTGRNVKRVVPLFQRTPKMGQILTVDYHNETQAIFELCYSPLAMGPDYVDAEQRLFCDMENREIYEFCEPASVGKCFDHGQLILTERYNGRGSLRSRSLREPYKYVDDRTEEGWEARSPFMVRL